MSAPVTRGSMDLVEKKGLSKYVAKFRSALKSRSSSKRFLMSSRTLGAGTILTPAIPSEPAAYPITMITPPDTPANISTTETPVPETEPSDIPQLMRSQIDVERARRLGERFNIPIEPNEWATFGAEKTVRRVEKSIRIRIHRTCHRCSATFGSSRVCPACEHRTCGKCPRYPPRQAREEEIPSDAPLVPAENSTDGSIEADDYYNLRESVLLTIPSRTGGQPLVRKRPMQRVRRSCHECSSLFPGGSKVCTNCSHLRCADCPRDPAKKKKYPDGYPGDEFSPTSTSPIKYNCHKCQRTYPAVPHPNSPEGIALGDTIEPLECSRCGHQRCKTCQRTPPQKVEPAPDPDVVKSLEAKLAQLTFRPVDI